MTTHGTSTGTSSTGLTTDDLAGRSPAPDPTTDSGPDTAEHRIAGPTDTRTDDPTAAEGRTDDGMREPDARQGDEPYPDLDDRAQQPSSADSTTTGTTGRDSTRLLDDAAAGPFAERWTEVQTRFVDDPRAAVRDADALVAELMQALAERFSQHKSGLEEQWNRGDEPTTESLRLALQQYRSFFDRLLST